MFQRNESTTDRIARTVVGGGLLAVSAKLGAASGQASWRRLRVVGIVLLFTAATGSCLAYRRFGISNRQVTQNGVRAHDRRRRTSLCAAPCTLLVLAHPGVGWPCGDLLPNPAR